MKSVRFWRMEARRLSLTERMFFRDAIRTLLSWHTMQEECVELEVIRKILDSEIRIVIPTEDDEHPNRRDTLSKRQSPGRAAEQTGLQTDSACQPAALVRED